MYVVFNGAERNVEAIGDVFVAQPICDDSRDFALSRRELFHRIGKGRGVFAQHHERMAQFVGSFEIDGDACIRREARSRYCFAISGRACLDATAPLREARQALASAVRALPQRPSESLPARTACRARCSVER